MVDRTSLTSIFIVLFWFLCIYSLSYFLAFLCFRCFSIWLCFFIVRCDCVGKKRKRIIQQQYPYAIQGETDLYGRIIPKIQKQKLTELINSRLVLNKDNLLFLIESLKSKKDENKYLYTVTNVTLTILIPALITLLVSYFVHLFNTIHMTIIVEYQMIGILVALLICIIYLDIVLFKNWKVTKERKQNRIIRTLENIYLEISNE